MPVRHTPEFWIERAEEAKAEARQLTDPQAQRSTLSVASDYEALAKNAAALDAIDAAGKPLPAAGPAYRYVLASNIERFEKQLGSGTLDATQTRTVIGLLREAKAELSAFDRRAGSPESRPANQAAAETAARRCHTMRRNIAAS